MTTEPLPTEVKSTLPKGVSNDRYRNALQNARDEFLESPELNDMDFPEWLEYKYGLKMLKNAYGNYDTIQHTLNYFIIILMQKNPSLIGKLGIKSLDIDIITNDLLSDIFLVPELSVTET